MNEFKYASLLKSSSSVQCLSTATIKESLAYLIYTVAILFDLDTFSSRTFAFMEVYGCTQAYCLPQIVVSCILVMYQSTPDSTNETFIFLVFA